MKDKQGVRTEKRPRRVSITAILRDAYRRNVRDALTRTAVKACLR